VPEISRFYGIIIMINFGDHNPPHFHVRYGQYKALIDINTGGLLAGNLPPRALGLVVEWSRLHKEELLVDWQLALEHKPLNKIKPLE
jgi:hypothetical protein